MGRATAIGTRARGILRRLDDEGPAFALLLVAAAASIGLGLWLTRGATFIIDEYGLFSETGDLTPRALADPFGGHLIAVERLLYGVYLRVFGTSHLPFELTTLLVNAAIALLLFKLLARRIGPFASLAASLPILFLGATPIGIQANAAPWGQATMFGLAAWLALGRRGRGGDVLACVALVLAVLSLEVGVAFAVGAAAWIAIEDRSPRRLWIVAVPLVIYAAWWLWARQFHEGFTAASNILLAPEFAAESAAAAVAAYLGLGIDLIEKPTLEAAATEWGRVLLPLLVVLVAVGLRRGRPPAAWWGALAVLLVFWSATSLGYGDFRGPDATRYAFVGIVGLLLVVGLAHGRGSPGNAARAAIVVALVFSIAGNLWLLRERGADIRSSSELNRARLAMVELHPDEAVRVLRRFIALPAEPVDYLRASERFGSLGLSVDELDSMSPEQAAEADRLLGDIASPTLAEARAGCSGERTTETLVELPAGGDVVIRSEQGATLTARRFAAAPSVEVGTLSPGKPSELAAPADSAPQPWIVSAGAGEVTVCEDAGPPA